MEDRLIEMLTYLKEVMKFYADEENYNSKCSDIVPHKIMVDMGFQARESLKRVDEILNEKNIMEGDFEDLVKNHEISRMGHLGDDTSLNKSLFEALENLKKEND